MLILHNARILTLDPAQPTATSLAIENDQLIAVGSDADVLALACPGAQTQDMRGQTIWPGLTDAHLHLNFYSSALQMVDCEVDTKAECLRRVAERARTLPAGEWVRGHGWNQNIWEGGFGTAADLDAVSYGHPAYLTDKSVHACWVNTLVLQMAGITAATPDPIDGKIGRCPDGSPNGILYESAGDLVSSILPGLTVAGLREAIAGAQMNFWKVGITSVHDYDGIECFQALQMLVEDDRLRMRVVKGIPLNYLPHAVEVGLRSGFGGDYLRIGSLKLFADGALGPRTAAMLQPYEGESEYAGIPMLDSEQIYEYGLKAVQGGISMAIHAIGDRANHEVIDAYEQLRVFETENGLPHFRHRIEHAQILHPDDLERMGRLKIVASMQPIHVLSDMFTADHHWGKRCAASYAWRSMLDYGAPLAFGSDAPVESINPFWGLHAAVTRTRRDGQPGPDGWYPEQRLSLTTALAGFTTGAAYAAGLENQLGRLKKGYYADLIVLPTDPFQIPAQELAGLLPCATMVAGQWVWQQD